MSVFDLRTLGGEVEHAALRQIERVGCAISNESFSSRVSFIAAPPTMEDRATIGAQRSHCNLEHRAALGAVAAQCLGVEPGDVDRRSWIATGLGVAVSVIVILCGFVWFRQQGGTVYTGHHSSDGSPPLIGILGILLTYLTCAGLALATIRARHAAKRAAAGQPVWQYETS